MSIGSHGLLESHQLSRSELEKFFKNIDLWSPDFASRNPVGCLAFFEPSTRTRISFERAGLDLGIKWVSLGSSELSLVKGESLQDNFEVLSQYNFWFFVVRHSENEFVELLSKYLNQPIFNAGCGTKSHPTQALGDLLTLLERFPDGNESICFYGDYAKSRVLRSCIPVLKKFNFKIFLCEDGETNTASLARELDVNLLNPEHIKEVSVVYVLRAQKERGGNSMLRPFSKSQLGEAAFWMHPGPVIRGGDIDESLGDFHWERCLVMKQVQNCFRVRRRLLFESLQEMK